MEFDFSKFRYNLINLTSNTGFDDKAIAKEVGMTAATLSRYKSGDRNMPHADQLIALSKYFRVPIDWLLGSADYGDTNPEEIYDLSSKYAIASDEDKQIIRMILNKYSKE